LLVGIDDSWLQAENDVASMWRILADMEEAGIRPDDRTYAYVQQYKSSPSLLA
jgi:pentatricopeptide repeat protein